LWRRAWDRVIPFFAFPLAVRRVVYMTNAIESVHSRLRKIIETRGHLTVTTQPTNSSGWRCGTSPPIGAERPRNDERR